MHGCEPEVIWLVFFLFVRWDNLGPALKGEVRGRGGGGGKWKWVADGTIAHAAGYATCAGGYGARGRVSNHVCELAGFVFFLLTCFLGFMCRSKRMRSHLHDVLCMPAFSCSRVATSGWF